ncbi:hypothetical protein HN011_005606 [Eciton burchellii]|nr:hypothetical protein HN011_005606 [Eciton burchellii]
MADDLHGFLEEQNTTIHAIKRIIPNYKKLSKVNITLPRTKARLADLQKLWEKAHRLHRISRAATTEETKKLPYFLQDEFLAAEDDYNEVADYLQDVISNFVTPESPAGNTPTDPMVDDEPQLSTVTLQRIPIPTFSGEFSEWHRFRHLFQSLVHSNKTMTKIVKFHYLISSVTGAAATTLDGLDVFPENYDDAWEALLKEYDNKRAPIRTHLQTIIHLPDGRLETAVELKKLKDTVRVALLNATKLECQISNWDSLLVTIMSEKFDPQTGKRSGMNT